MRHSIISRRNALLGLGSSALLPFLRPTAARSDDTPAKRLVVWFTPCGTHEPEFRPTGGENDFVLGKILQPLEPYRDKLLLFGPNEADAPDASNVRKPRGISMTYDGSNPAASGEHASYQILTGRFPNADRLGNGISLDQYVASKIGADDFLPSIQLGVDAKFPEMCYAGPGQQLPVENNPALAFQTLFGSLSGPSEEELTRKARRKHVIDTVAAQSKSLAARLSANDKARVEAQQSALEALSARLDKTFVCEPPVLAASDPAYWQESDWDNYDKMPEIADAQIELLATALGCGITHVGSMQFGWCAANARHPFVSAPEYIHELSHNMFDFATGTYVSEPTNKLVDVNTWYMERLAAFVGMLDAMPESNGTTVLDNTVILVVNELSKGDWHCWQNMPFFLVGGAGGYLKTGRYLKFENKSHNDLLVSVLNAMGIDESTFGDPALCSGPLPGLTA